MTHAIDERAAGPALVAPFPWFGGKSLAATEVWQALGEVKNYVEPFAGSIAVLLSAQRVHEVETVNDADGFIANFWRAVAAAPDAVARWADWPVNEADLEARHAWLVARKDRLRWSLEDPDFYDAKIAGWWLWGQCAWIGSGWCSGAGPHRHDGAHFVAVSAGQGINRKLPHLGDAGRGDAIRAWMQALSDRLRDVRVACGDWSRVCTPSVTWRHGLTGVFLDPPYGEGAMDYSAGGNRGPVAEAVWAWAIEHGENEKMRIVVAAYEDGRAVPPGWTVRRWRARGGYAVDKERRKREVLYCSPHCLPLEATQQRALLDVGT